MKNSRRADRACAACDEGRNRWAARVLRCARKTVMRYLDTYPEVTQIAQDEVELALDMAERSLFVDAASEEPDARRFLLLTCSRAGARADTSSGAM